VFCQGFDQYANVRPAQVLPGVKSPLLNGDQIDWVVVRENSEGEYSGNCSLASRAFLKGKRHVVWLAASRLLSNQSTKLRVCV
jgi:isocitrate/isopropylmalate dehydrogenase